jgi:hypothetical protein
MSELLSLSALVALIIVALLFDFLVQVGSDTRSPAP